MRAAIFHGPGQPLEVAQVPDPSPAPGEALVSIRCATLCGSDLHTLAGRRSAPAPSILGHEMVGELLTPYAGLQAGTRVTWSMVWSCGGCFYCSRQLRPKCERLRKFGHGDLGGGFAEQCLLPAGTAVYAVPDKVPDAVAAPANCATATVAAVMRRAPAQAGEAAVIMGAGMLGLQAAMWLKTAGWGPVHVVDVDAERARRALAYGADALNIPARAGLALDFTGSPEAMETAMALLRPGGVLLLAGAVFPARPLAVAAEDVVRRMLRIEGIHNYEPEDLATALRFLAEQRERYDLAALTEGHFGLGQVNEAIAWALSQKPPRVAVYPQE